MAIQVAAVEAFWAWEARLPHQVEIGEAPVLTAVLFAKTGQPLYSYPAGLPLVQNPYGPVFEWLCIGLPASSSQPYLVGRAISLAALLGLGILVAGWLRRRQAEWLEVFVALALMVSTKPWVLFGPLYRVDALAVFLSVLGFLLAISKRRGGVPVSLVVFTIAVSVKLTALSAPFAAVAYLWMTNRRRALGLVAGLLVLLPSSILVLQAATDGAYLFNASFGNAPSHWFKALELPSRVSLSLFWLLAVGAAMRRLESKGASETRALLLYTLASLLVAALFATNPLSSWNYLMEFYAALAILTGLLLSRMSLENGTYGKAQGKMLTLLAVHAALSLLISTQTVWETSRRVRDYQTGYERAYERIEPLVRDGHNVIVLDSTEGKDVLNVLGRPNLISVPQSVERRSDIQALIERSLPASGDAVVLEGPALNVRKLRGGHGSTAINPRLR